MINSLHPLIPHAGSPERSALVDQLARKVDSNRDGQVTTAEFSSFLSGLMQSLDAELRDQRAPIAEPAATQAGATVLAPAGEPVALTRAQGAALLKQAFAAVTRSR